MDIKEYENIFGEEMPNLKKDVKRIGIFSNSELVGYGSMRIERVIYGVQGATGRTEAHIDQFKIEEDLGKKL